MKTSYFPAALCAVAFGTAATASAQTVTPIPLNYNFNGIVHDGEQDLPDNPDGYRSIADRGLNFAGGTPSDLSSYMFVTDANVVDMVYLGNRNAVDGGGRAFDTDADGDDIGIQPNWLTNVDQTGPQTTTLASPIAIGGISSATFLLQISNGGGTLDCTIGFQSGATTTASIGAPDWFGGPYAGTDSTDRGRPGAGLNITEVSVDLSAFDGDAVTSVTFSNPDNDSGGKGYAIVAGNINSGQTAVTVTPVPLDFNFNGIVHAGERDVPDDPDGFRAMSDRSLDFTGGVPSNSISDPFVLQDQAGALDIVHLGNRNTVTGGNWAFEDTADGNDIGIQPNWLTDVDQSGPQVTTLASPIPIGSGAEGKVLFQISDGGGSFDVAFSLASGGTVNGTVTGSDWFGGTFAGCAAVDKGLPSNNLSLTVGTIDLSGVAGDSITAVSFSNSSNTGAGVAILAVNIESIGLGSNYCDAEVNSSGQAASMGAVGSDVASDNNLTLTASNLPSNQFALLAVAPLQGFVPGANGTSNGNLCLDFNSIGRLAIVNSGASGALQYSVDLTAIPQGSGTVSTTVGQTWNFQAWYRDSVGLGSNFTDGISITFQ